MDRYKVVELINKIFNRQFFTYSELCCKCGCNRFDSHEEFLKKLLLFRVLYNEPFRPTSVYRCKNHPDYSTNHDGWAFDIAYNWYDSKQRLKIIKCAITAGFKRLGIAYDFIHIDCNPEYNNTFNEEVMWIYK